MAKEILRMEDVTKIYDNGFVANKNVTFWLHESEILALVGENGAGKTTLMKVLFGLETPQTGKVYMDGKEVKILNTLDAIEKGIGMVHQHFMLIPSLTVAENVVLGVEPMKNGLFDFKKAVEMTDAEDRDHEGAHQGCQDHYHGRAHGSFNAPGDRGAV